MLNENVSKSRKRTKYRTPPTSSSGLMSLSILSMMIIDGLCHCAFSNQNLNRDLSLAIGMSTYFAKSTCNVSEKTLSENV